MEATALSVGKSVLDGAIGYAKSAFAEEVALQLGVRRDQVFITNELEMMKAFLESAHGEGADDKVVKVWVKQVRDMAYDVEDCLQEFAVRLNKQSWWRIRRKMLDRRRVAKQMKELRANVEDVSQRNTRYSLIKGSGSKAATYTAAEQSSITSAALFGIDEARRAAKQEKSQVDLVQMINEEENNLRVIAVWGTSGGLGQTSIVRKAYENPDIESKFSCRAWVRLMHPFDPKDFVQSMVEQFNAAGGVNVLLRKKKTVQELTNKFEQYVNEKRYLIVINDLSTIEEWDRVKKCFPNNNMGSRIIVSTTQVEVASLCAGQGSVASELKQFSAGQNIYAFHDKGSQDATDLINEGSSSNTASTSTANKSTVPTCEISEENTVKKSLTRIRTMVAALEESHLVGREKEKSEIIKLVTGQATGQFEVITVWGMGGLGKTTLVKDIYQSQELSDIFDNRACVTVMRPFNLEELLRSLFMQLDRESSEKKDVVGLMSSTKNTLLLMSLAELIKELAKLFQTKRCLIVLDDVLSTAEWDRIEPIFHEMRKTIRIIVTTREESIAKHCCSQKQENIYKLKDLEYKDAHDLFTKKVFKGTVDLDKQYPELVQPAKLILKKCDQLPLAIVTIACFLATQPKAPLEWRKLSEHLSAELEMNPQLGTIRTVLMRSYDGLPYHLKSCFLYMPIFPEDHRVGRGRLARRWSAEGYCREVRGKSAEEMADSYFMELIARSMILPPQESIRCTKGIDSCQVHDLMREIGISKSMEENLVFTLEQGCSTNSQVTMRHLAISSNWEGDQNEFESMVDVSRVRSLTVFGKWKSFFISDRMRLLRVLDLEDATGLLDHHLKHIGKFLHLRYLSLRGCGGIFHLPDLLGNLRQLETLDIRGTNVVMLPKTIIKLLKLKSLRAGEVLLDEDVSYEEIIDDFPKT
ncbi:putative disease resistance protein At1g59780 isoform X2 [Brachypodium distachyon]|uniref:putative disease resistance protein At1g59780 isoform X2 n=1 Tax=Brachypodium distachyon TaxID=15368 RepID=UPI0006E49AD5|nr:putative disease resistance protein At1g59780 isoform X2 [Brachypodium distachyon]|eukprot:XP_024315523.1 putative disease resistance protein At1g59780 isoform X2 [Brachypodium distachyon]